MLEALPNHNGWVPKEKATYLLATLEGEAAKIIQYSRQVKEIVVELCEKSSGGSLVVNTSVDGADSGIACYMHGSTLSDGANSLTPAQQA
jgi:hypothetical protein